MKNTKRHAGRPRTVTDPKLPKGIRAVDGKLYWRGTDEATRAIEDRLRDAGISRRCGSTPTEARRWYRENVAPHLDAHA
jgi:hypothetical protein